jgi:hypothetical protein
MTNYYKSIKAKQEHNPCYGQAHMFKVPFRMLILGGSGSGKTNTMLDIISRMDKTFNKIILCTKDRNEPLYDLLKKKLKSDLQIYDGDIPIPGSKNKFQPNIPDLDTIDKDEQTLVIFDDLCLDNCQEKIGQYFIRGRKRNVSSVYISQSYFKTPKIIRLQCGYYLFKKQANKRDLSCILRESMLPYSVNELISMYSQATRKFEDFLFIDNTQGKCYIGFDTKPFGGADEMVDEDEKKDINEVFTKPAPLPRKKKLKSTNYDNLHDERLSAINYVEMLEANSDLRGLFRFPDIYNDYKEWCKANSFEIASNRILGKTLTPVFRKRKLTDCVAYLIHCTMDEI